MLILLVIVILALGGWWLAAVWWFAFSGGLWFIDTHPDELRHSKYNGA